MEKHPRTIDALIKWIEQRLFHDEYKAPTQKDLHIWLKHAKKFKREQDNLKVDNAELRQKLTKLLGQVSDISGVNLEAKISVLRLWAEPEMDRRRALESGGDDDGR